jgi:ubiquinone/menaquinone biosynthesis C-methylase UbiE
MAVQTNPCMSTIPERFTWAASLVQIAPADTILEIGCGAGLLAEQIAGRLSTGHITAIDKSASMITKAKKRNKQYVDAGITNFITIDFSKALFPEAHFDSMVAFNVNFFLKGGVKEFDMIRHCCKPGGKLYVFYQAPYEIDIRAAQPIVQHLTAHSFSVADTVWKKMSPFSALCVIAEP